MKASVGLLCIFALANASQVEVTPVQKVIQLLGGMMEKGKKEKHEEQVMFAAQKQFCDDEESTKVRAIKEEEETIDRLAAKIAKDAVDAAHLQKQITALSKDEDTWSGDKKAATSVRQIEKTDYDATHKDYSESIDALQRAVNVLRKQSHDRGQRSSLAQVASLKDLNLVPAAAKKAIDLFLQQGEEESALVGSEQPEGLAVSAPEANAYEFQSNGIIEMLEKLTDKFIDERTNLEKEEANSKHAFHMLMQDLEAQIKQAGKDRREKSSNRMSRLQSKADSMSDKKETENLNAIDEKYLHDLKASCAMKASDFEARQQLRSEEIASLEKTVDILGSSSVKGNAAKHLPTLMQKKGKSLGQLRSNSNTKIQHEVAQFLSMRAEKLHSRVLATVAKRAELDPYAKVKKMIKALVVRLMEEANEEADHKGWCDTELGTNLQTRTEKTEEVEALHAAIDQLNASISKTTEVIGELTKAVSDLHSAMADATKIRNTEKNENTEAITDAQEAQTALAQANTVLKEFYSRAAEATSLVQTDRPYKGMQDENGGVVAMLEVIESDFARLEADTKANEATSQKKYDEFMTDSKADSAAKNTAIEHKSSKKQDEEQALVVKKTDLEQTQKSLDAALTYFDKLKPSCVDSGVSYEDRVQRRKEEIESLQESLNVLNGMDLAALQLAMG